MRLTTPSLLKRLCQDFIPLNFRQLTIRTFLCGILVAGQILGWVHVSDCGDSSTASLSFSSGDSCGCCFEESVFDDFNSGTKSVGSSESRRGHDCNSCLICRSIVTNNAEEACLYDFPQFQAIRVLSTGLLVFSYLSTRLSVAQPRAPPLG